MKTLQEDVSYYGKDIRFVISLFLDKLRLRCKRQETNSPFGTVCVIQGAILNRMKRRAVAKRCNFKSRKFN